MRVPRRLRAGVASAQLPIFPNLDLAGFAVRQNPATGWHDPLWVRALALESNGHVTLLIAVDVLGFSLEDAAEIRERIVWRLERPDITLSVVLGATHTHSAPASMTLRGCGEVNAKWLKEVRRRIIETAVDASSRLQNARIGAGSGQVEGVSFNRCDSHGPLDTELGVLKIETGDGKPLACVLNFACHPVVLGGDNLEVSADYPGRVADLVAAQTGATTLFLNGATGDVNPCQRNTWDDVEHLAGQVAQETCRVWNGLSTQTDVVLAACSRRVSLLLSPLDTEMQTVRSYQEAQRSAAAAWTKPGHRHAELVRERVETVYNAWAQQVTQLAQHDRDGEEETTSRAPALTVELQVVQIGALLLAAVPGELFTGLGLQIKARLQASSRARVWVVGYANGNLGYIPSREAYARGGYEVETAHRFYGQPCCAAPEAGEMVVENLVALGTVLQAKPETSLSEAPPRITRKPEPVLLRVAH